MPYPRVALDTLYNRYIRVPDLLNLSHSDQDQTADEALARSLLYTLILWRRVEERELQALLDLLQKPLALEGYQDALKRIDRCLAVNEILLTQGRIARSHLLAGRPRLRFRLWPLPPDPLWARVADLTSQLARYPGAYQLMEPPIEGGAHHLLATRLRERLLAHQEALERIGDQTERLLQWLAAYPAPSPLRFEELVPEAELLALSDHTIQAYHHGSQNSDILSFITIHQVFEIWFPSALAAMLEAIALLAEQPPRVLHAEVRVQRLTAILRLFATMILYPQTMTAADYYAFRAEIKDKKAPGGSGAESEQFRFLEILMGLRDHEYRHNLYKIRMLAPHEEIFAMPSLHSSFLEVARARGVIATGETDEEMAIKLSLLFRPSGEANPHADLASLAEALLDAEQGLDKWRYVHIGMVDRLMGGQRESLGIAGQAANRKGDSKPYLVKTLHYGRIFKPLFDARNHLQRAIGGTGAPRADPERGAQDPQKQSCLFGE